MLAIKTQATNAFNFRWSEINEFILFLDFSATFFQNEWTHVFWARPLKILRFGGVLEETHGTAYLEVVREVLKEEQDL